MPYWCVSTSSNAEFLQTIWCARDRLLQSQRLCTVLAAFHPPHHQLIVDYLEAALGVQLVTGAANLSQFISFMMAYDLSRLGLLQRENIRRTDNGGAIKSRGHHERKMPGLLTWNIYSAIASKRFVSPPASSGPPPNIDARSWVHYLYEFARQFLVTQASLQATHSWLLALLSSGSYVPMFRQAESMHSLYFGISQATSPDYSN